MSTFFRSSLRSFATTAKSAHHNNHRDNHKFLPPTSFLGSWEAPKDPKEAEAKLAQLRRDYAKQVKELRKEYIEEMELMRLEKQRKDEARREALRVATEERKRLKAQEAEIRAQQRNIEQQQFRETLLKERAEKLEYWRRKVKMHEEKKAEKNELLRRQSSMWVDEAEIEKQILDTVIATTHF
ncbi:uncharacterized protein LOC130734824 [Lotus japonicus]|uniref:uncharacterized protein LOC130734824 n=1 Tax=Lotus japonicus TaxID=34305 RepID=UPI002584095A|nr:uncharacterized protein LOC130734824 [Lotus japonicus]